MITPTAEKVQDVLDAKAPTNVSQLRSYLGLINYCHKFVRNLSTVLKPLYELLSKKQCRWSDCDQSAFKISKAMLLEAPCGVHYDPKLPIVVSCDESPYSIGAVLSHITADGDAHPVCVCI